MQNIKKPRIIAIIGPTASGKSDLAIGVATKIRGEILSADSRQVYKGMDIGTGKVTKKEQKIIKHYLLDVASPKKVFTADDFKKHGQKALKAIFKKNKTPIIVGGTGFYIDILLDRMGTASVPPNRKLRENLEQKTNEELLNQLKKLDPEKAHNIDFKNKRRLIRALEIVITTGKPITKLTHSESFYQITWLGIRLSKEELEKRIKMRLEKRLRQGMIVEVKKLLKSGVSYKRLEDLGLEYRYISRFLRGFLSKEEMFDELYSEIKKYSKRQMTWFKRNKEIQWFSPPLKLTKIIKLLKF